MWSTGGKQPGTVTEQLEQKTQGNRRYLSQHRSKDKTTNKKIQRHSEPKTPLKLKRLFINNIHRSLFYIL